MRSADQQIGRLCHHTQTRCRVKYNSSQKRILFTSNDNNNLSMVVELCMNYKLRNRMHLILININVDAEESRPNSSTYVPCTALSSFLILLARCGRWPWASVTFEWKKRTQRSFSLFREKVRKHSAHFDHPNSVPGSGSRREGRLVTACRSCQPAGDGSPLRGHNLTKKVKCAGLKAWRKWSGDSRLTFISETPNATKTEPRLGPPPTSGHVLFYIYELCKF